MAAGNALSLAGRRTTTFANAAALAVANAFKTLIATDNVNTHTYSVADLNGALANPGPVGEAQMRLPRFPSVTTTADANTYNTTDPILFYGTYGGVAATVSLLLTAIGGGQTIIGATPLDTLAAIYVPVQLTANGEFTFGFSGVAARKSNGMTQRMPFKGNADGIVNVGYEDGTTDLLSVTSGVVESASPYRIIAASTTVGVTIYD